MTNPPVQSPLCDAIRDHHGRAWRMAVEAARNVTESHWRIAENPRLVPARVAYHLLMGGERYTWRARANEFLATRRYNLSWLDAPIEQLPGLDDCASALEGMRESTDLWLREAGDDGLLRTPPVWPWCGNSLLGQALYLLRHTQCHVADISSELRRLGLPTPKWQ